MQVGKALQPGKVPNKAESARSNATRQNQIVKSAPQQAVIATATKQTNINTSPPLPNIPNTDLRFALGHYHQAVMGMIMVRNNPEFDIVVEASILLIVIELWRGDPRAAMIHFSHARLIMDCYTPRAKLEKVFWYLNFFLFFFGFL